jgi:ketosteroid isomerase-like protein
MASPLVEDRLAITDLFSRYMWAIDGGDVETLVSCFMPDGALESPAVGKYAGHDNIRAFASRFADFRKRGTELRHVLSNMLIDIDGDRGFAKCYLLVFQIRNGASKLLGPGRYECRLRKDDGEWRFEHRLVVMDHDYELEGI